MRHEGIFLCRVCPEHSYFMGIYRVMFGYRVRSGRVHAPCADIDLCGGSDVNVVSLLYSYVLSVLENSKTPEEALKILPSTSDVKPVHRDSLVWGKVLAAMSQPGYKHVAIDPTELLKEQRRVSDYLDKYLTDD